MFYVIWIIHIVIKHNIIIVPIVRLRLLIGTTAYTICKFGSVALCNIRLQMVKHY